MSNTLILPIEGFEGYFTTPKGQIIGPRGKALKGGPDKNGYILVTLRKDGKNFTRKVHRLICEAYWKKPEGCDFVNHKDGVKDNNHPDNLEWVTASQNTIHSYETGLQRKGEGHGRSKISDEDVQYIRDNYIKYDPVYGGAGLGRRFGLDRSQVNRIAKGHFR